MKDFFKALITAFLMLVCIYILEGACFRLVEDYAKLRLQFAWGSPGNGSFHSILKKLPLDHFLAPPLPSEEVSTRMEKENKYATKIMSFGRPTRDRLKEEILTSVRPLSEFEIKDFGEIESVILPGLQKPATKQEVINKLARRIADPMEYAKGLLVRVIPSTEKHKINEEFKRLEAVFKFILQQGIACVVLPVKDTQDLLEKTQLLRKKNPLIAENLFLWGDQTGADYAMEATAIEPALYKVVMTNDPVKNISPPQVKGVPWLLMGVPRDFSNDEQGLSNLLSWADRGRDADKLYPSRVGGLIKFVDNQNHFESFALPFLLLASEYIEGVGKDWPESVPLLNQDIDLSVSSPNTEETVRAEPSVFSLEEKIKNLQKSESIDSTGFATFDCEIVRGYRELHAQDKNLRKVTNRDLVLKLGMGFEEMGEEVLLEIGERDPLFLRFYRSLKAVQDSPLN
jgi:hypothetical protein